MLIFLGGSPPEFVDPAMFSQDPLLERTANGSSVSSLKLNNPIVCNGQENRLDECVFNAEIISQTECSMLGVGVICPDTG